MVLKGSVLEALQGASFPFLQATQHDILFEKINRGDDMSLTGIHPRLVRDSMKHEVRGYVDPEPEGFASSRRKSIFGKILAGFGKMTAPVATTLGIIFPPALPLVAVGAGLYGVGVAGDYIAAKNAVPPPPGSPNPQALSFPGLGGNSSVQSTAAQRSEAVSPSLMSDPRVMRILMAKGDSTQEALDHITV